MKTVLYCISETYPIGPAYASRTKAITDILFAIGYSIIVLCDMKVEDSNVSTNTSRVIEVLPKKSNKIVNIIKLPTMYEQAMEKIISNNKIDVIISRSMFDRFGKIIKISKKYNIPLVLESCERYHFSNWRFGIFNPRYWQFKFDWHFLYKKVDGVIAISNYLKNYYENSNIYTIHIPAIINVNNLELEYSSTDEKIKILFFGSLGNGKDLVKPVIKTLIRNKYLASKFDFHLYGPSIKQVKKLFLPSLDLTRYQFIKIHKRIKTSEFSKVLPFYHYGLLLRPNRISSIAGFPTKFVDYMSFGLPVITNGIGDIKNYVLNRENGFIIDKLNIKKIENILTEILSLDINSYNLMRMSARRTVDTYFSTKIYNEGLREFMDNVLKEKINGETT